MAYAHITGWGLSVPDTILTNDDLSKIVDTNDAWIRERTGIRQRHIVRAGQTASSLALEASFKALEIANLAPTELDLIICSSSSPEYVMRSNFSVVVAM